MEFHTPEEEKQSTSKKEELEQRTSMKVRSRDKDGGTGPAGPALAGPLYRQIIIFIKNFFGIPGLIVLNENVVSNFDLRNYQQQLTDVKRVLPNEVVARRNIVLPTTIAFYE